MSPEELVKKVKRLKLYAHEPVKNLFAGLYRARTLGQGVAFSEFREYVPGDDVRHLSWPLFAKTAKAYVKRYEEERESPLVLAVDTSASMYFGQNENLKPDVQAMLAAVLAFSALENANPVALLLFAGDIISFTPAKHGEQHVYLVLSQICKALGEGSAAHAPKSTDIAAACWYLTGVLKKHSQVFLLSDFLSHNFAPALSQLKRKHQVLGLRLTSPYEHNMPPMGLVPFKSSEGALGHVVCDTSSAVFVRHYKAQMQKKNFDIKQTFNRAGTRLLEINITQDPTQALASHFKQHKSL